MRHPLLTAISAALTTATVQASTDWFADSSTALPVQPAITFQAQPFALSAVRLLDGPFRRAQELDRQYLRSLPPDRLLHTFRLTAGLPSAAEPLGGWEAPQGELRGHFVGHYLSGCALLVASTGDAVIQAHAAQVVAGLAECQAQLGSGYLSAYPESFFDRLEAHKPVWAPWYTMHKIYAGLLDQYLLCGNVQALDVLKRASDWVQRRTDRLSDEQLQEILTVEHGGMNEVLANVYAATGEARYLRLARRFNHHAVLDPLARREDKLTGLHANTQFPKVIGAARQYELTGDASLATTATFFWDVVTGQRSYVVGGNSDYEHFSRKEELSRHIGPATTETCNTYNMLKLTRQLFAWEPRPQYADFYERALFNHILASQHPESGMMIYYLPLRSGCSKLETGLMRFNTPLDSFWCCTGTGVENHAKYADSIYFRGRQGELYVNLFIASQLEWRQRQMTVRQETEFPRQASTRLTLAMAEPQAFKLYLRRPYWATTDFRVTVNGRPTAGSALPGGYLCLDNTWRNGDRVEIERMPMSLHVEGFHDNPRRVALMYGPLVLVTPTELHNTLSIIRAPAEKILESIRPVADKPLTFTASAEVFRTHIGPDSSQRTFVPIYEEYRDPYIVYWDLLDDAGWAAKAAALRAEEQRLSALRARMADQVAIEPISEKQHKLRGERTDSGVFRERSWRHARGWFSYDLKLPPAGRAELLCTYWGDDKGRQFEILVDGQRLITEKLDHNRPGSFFDAVYPLPAEWTKGKNHVTIRFQAVQGSIAGGVFGCAILQAPDAPPQPGPATSPAPTTPH